jgi:hypothetical protein
VKRVVDDSVKIRVKPDGFDVGPAYLKTSMNAFDEILVEAAISQSSMSWIEQGDAAASPSCAPLRWPDLQNYRPFPSFLVGHLHDSFRGSKSAE